MLSLYKEEHEQTESLLHHRPILVYDYTECFLVDYSSNYDRFVYSMSIFCLKLHTFEYGNLQTFSK